jgi:hypothetical protein
VLSQGALTGQRFELASVAPLPSTVPLDWGHLALYELPGDPVPFRDAWAAFVPSGKMTPPPQGVELPLTCILLAAAGPVHEGSAPGGDGDLAERHLLLSFSQSRSDEASLGDWYEEDYLPRLRSAPGLIRAQRFQAAGTEPFPGTIDHDVDHLVVYELTGDPGPFREYVDELLSSDAVTLPQALSIPVPTMFMAPVSSLAVA